MLPSAKHAFKAILCATVLSLAMPSCRNGNEAQTTDKSIADSLARLRQEGKAMRNESRFDEALKLHTRGLDLAKEVGDTLEWVKALNNIGTDYRRMSMLDVAQEYHYSAWKLSEDCTDTSFTARKNRVVSLNGLGNIYMTLGNYERADSVLRMALKGERELGTAPFSQGHNAPEPVALAFQSLLQPGERVDAVGGTHDAVGCTPIGRGENRTLLAARDKQETD